MKTKNSFNFVSTILYKIYEDCVLLSNKLRNRHIRVDDINTKIKNWIQQLEHLNIPYHQLNLMRTNLIDELNQLKVAREVLVYDIWNMQNKIECLIYAVSLQMSK